MRFTETRLAGAWLIQTDKHEDARGFFTRFRCSREFDEHGLPTEFVQTNLSQNRYKGTFRGLHFQVPPSREAKLVRCVAGVMHDVIVDLRPDSPTFLEHLWFRLDAKELEAVFLPAGFAHGFLTGTDDTMVIYEMTDFYAPELGRGIRWNDPALQIEMPGEVRRIHPRDNAYADLDPGTLSNFGRRTA